MAATETDRLQSDYETLRSRCGLVDRSERGKLALTGSGAVEFLNGQITNELVGLRPGEGRYAAFLTNKGKMLGDLRVLAVGEDAHEPTLGPTAARGAAREPAAREPGGAHDPSAHDPGASASGAVRELLLDTERGALQALFDMIRRYKIGYDVALHKRTVECAQLSLIGPRAPEVAARAAHLADGGVLPRAEHGHVRATVAGRPARLIATADGGLDVLCASADREALAAALLEAGAREVGEETAEVVRVERGRPRYGVDLDDSTIPQEAGLNERAVSFTKGCYVGQETVARLHYRGKPNRHLRGLRISDPAHAAVGDELRLGERSVGRLGSFVRSPRHGPIGLALVRREASPGDTVAVGEHGASAAVAELPFD